MKYILFLPTLFLLIHCTPNEDIISYESRDYNVYMRGNLAGKQTSSLDSDGNYNYTFEYNDRGRGPEIKEKIKLNSNGTISSLEISGLNYLKDSVSEIFNDNGATVNWKSNSENGEKDSNESSFYASVNGTLGDTELLIRLLLDAPNQSATLYPSGKVSISKIEQMEVENTTLRLVEIKGMGFTPSYTWIDDDNRIFASVSSWLTIIEEKNEDLKDQLLEIQTKKENAFFANLAKVLTEIPRGKTIIKNVNLFDSPTASIIPNRSVVIEGNSIVAVLKEDESLPNAEKIIEGKGKTLLPGLFDNHCHVGREDGILHLAAGVTSVRDMANSRELLEIRKEFDENINVGPRIVTMAGFIDQKGPFAGPELKITNVEEGIKAIDNYKTDGYHQIKLYSSIDPSWVKPLAAHAHNLGLKLSGHIPAYMLAAQAIKDGFDEIQHVNMLVLNFLSDTIDTRTPLRFSAVAEHAHMLDLEGKEFISFIKLLKDKDIEIDPTVSIFEGMFTTKAGEPDPQFAAILDRLPLQVSRGFYSGGLPIPSGKEQQYKDSFQKLLDIIYELYVNEITILPGTDATPGFSLHKELENYVKAGIPANEVLKMATITSAIETWSDDKVGSITEGKLADMILVDGDPTRNISDIRRVVLTIKDGKIYSPKPLYASLGIKHFE